MHDHFFRVKNSQKMEWGFYYCLKFRRHFFRHTRFQDLKISKKKFLSIWVLRSQRKMCRLFPCIPIFRGAFLSKSVKKCVCVMGLKIALLLVKNVCFGVKKGMSKMGVLGSCKTHYWICRCDFWNNSKTTLYYTIKLGQIMNN